MTCFLQKDEVKMRNHSFSNKRSRLIDNLKSFKATKSIAHSALVVLPNPRKVRIGQYGNQVAGDLGCGGGGGCMAVAKASR